MRSLRLKLRSIGGTASRTVDTDRFLRQPETETAAGRRNVVYIMPQRRAMPPARSPGAFTGSERPFFRTPALLDWPGGHAPFLPEPAYALRDQRPEEHKYRERNDARDDPV